MGHSLCRALKGEVSELLVLKEEHLLTNIWPPEFFTNTLSQALSSVSSELSMFCAGSKYWSLHTKVKSLRLPTSISASVGADRGKSMPDSNTIQHHKPDGLIWGLRLCPSQMATLSLVGSPVQSTGEGKVPLMHGFSISHNSATEQTEKNQCNLTVFHCQVMHSPAECGWEP